MTELRLVCPGWAGVHSEPIVLREGSEPVSHGMCKKCCAAWAVQAGIDPSDVVCSNQAHETRDHDHMTEHPLDVYADICRRVGYDINEESFAEFRKNYDAKGQDDLSTSS